MKKEFNVKGYVGPLVLGLITVLIGLLFLGNLYIAL